jgi:nitrite reductase/ring-hydroxylating ferredoxin subunit
MWIKIFSSDVEARAKLKMNVPQLVIIGELRVVIVLLADRVVAVQDYCTHNKESLSNGKVNYAGEIICPWHGHCFNLKTGRESQQRSADLKTYAVMQHAMGLFIDVS